jgi:hypothetical protein
MRHRYLRAGFEDADGGLPLLKKALVDGYRATEGDGVLITLDCCDYRYFAKLSMTADSNFSGCEGMQ